MVPLLSLANCVYVVEPPVVSPPTVYTCGTQYPLITTSRLVPSSAHYLCCPQHPPVLAPPEPGLLLILGYSYSCLLFFIFIFCFVCVCVHAHVHAGMQGLKASH